MSPFECYSEYTALKNHFNKSNYDYFKYNGKVNVNKSTFDSLSDRFLYDKLSKKDDPHNYILSNIIENNKIYIRSLVTDKDCDLIYRNWLKRNQSLLYTFNEELKLLDIKFNNNFVCSKNDHPILLKRYISKEVSVETFCILMQMSKAIILWDNKMKGDVIWDNVKFKLVKYTPFITGDVKDYKSACLKWFK